ncbi:MAG: hypothetical protein CSA72_09305 [Rhodobacterales bacterium]|nr:MAG: hypothetical protein CSA72_09305 [Rhodobacterales bacterium]
MTDGWAGILEEGENILWQGRPDGRFRIVPRLLPQSIFGLVFFAFAAFWIVMAASMTGGGIFGALFPLFGLPFALVGLGMMVGTHLWDMIQRRGTYYTLTDRRGFIATDLPVVGRGLRGHLLKPSCFGMTQRGGLTDVQIAEHRDDGAATPVLFQALTDGASVMSHLSALQNEVRS